ncbi:MAG TPA: MBL fold metallo-hydrolase [Spirochaetota bacterium]|nr:MBL fold metallo-hydrolase [Spirochaetota bacterium]HOD16169.1 MBL fold metallo-hydrolase [Spirochaetota bacterium]HPG50810.1 MBL fold metallo-hydrolase [Spirochaetota bacterium]HPN13082.1 MBL fold metallo-hydrolase [Spirochaetota bacterium]HQL82623.1 MBL fold metallo-hydrolase [Spirochaetota bacterium]
MDLISLQSGSNGNCIYVETGDVRLLFDAGISGRQAAGRLAAAGRDITRVNALIVSHDHADHVRCAGIYQRKFGIPLHVTETTLRAAQSSCDLGALGEVSHFRAGDPICFGRVRVETIRTPHDGADGVAFIVDDGISRLGIFTDLGHVYDDLKSALATVDAALIESNYDPDMLQNGPYPRYLKSRITGPKGHISNIESAELIAQCGTRLRWACLGHLSEQNNTPELTLRTHRAVNGSMRYHMAGRYGAGDLLKV